MRDLQTPALLIERSRVVANCERMLQKASASKVIFRPHVKTHKTLEVARLQHGGSAGPITVSTLAEAEFFADAGFHDIAYAVPFSPDKLDRARALRQRTERFAILVDSTSVVRELQSRLYEGESLDTYVKIDCGYHRAGVAPESDELREIARQVLTGAQSIRLRGLLTHAGHSYHAKGREQILELARAESAAVSSAAEILAELGVRDQVRSVGSTPTATVVERFEHCDEVRPGNYVFFDAFQAGLGTATLDDCALSVLASVIGIYPEQRKIMIDAGTLALAREAAANGTGFGLVCDDALRPIPYELRTMSQEHGQLFFTGTDAAWKLELERLDVGARLRIVANHSCITAAMYDRFHVVEGGRVVDEWHPARGW